MALGWYRLRFCQAVLAIVLATWGSLPSSVAQAWSFIAFGDSRGMGTEDQINTNILSELARAIVREHPAFVLMHGDLATVGAEAAFQDWTNLFAPVYAAGIGVYPVLGNHDLADVTGFTNVFGPTLPDNGPADELDRTYAFAYSNALVLNLDTYMPTNSLRINQAWVDARLATNTLPHVFVQAHVPAFKMLHGDCLGSYPLERNCFWQSLRDARCRLYFCGHDHFYDHAELEDGDGNPDNNVHQMIVGSAGAPLYQDGAYTGDNGPWTPVRWFHEMNFGFLKVEVEALRVCATWYHRVDADRYEPTTDAFTYSLAPRPTLRFSFAEGRLTLSWSEGATLQAALDPYGSFADVPGAVSPFTVTNLAPPPLYFRVSAPDPPPKSGPSPR